jgi:septal ring factor EnvC (AmiA/AmiB activator)
MYVNRENGINQIRENLQEKNMFYFLLKIIVCVLVVFCIHTIWQTVQQQCIRPRIKNTNAEIEKYKSLVEQISQQNQSREKNKILENKSESELVKDVTELESDLNSFLDSILIENHIEIMPVV